MIKGFWEIGKELKKELKPEAIVDYLVLDVEEEKKGRKQHIVILKVGLNNKSCSLDIDFKEISEDSIKKYLWVGNSPSPNSPQDRFTTNHLEYLISQTIPNLINKLPNCNLKSLLKGFKEKIYFDLGGGKDRYERYRFIWDLSKFGFDLTPHKVREEIKDLPPNEKGKQAVKIVADRVRKFIDSKTKLKKDDIAFFTLKVDNKILAQEPEYKEYIYRSLIEEVFQDSVDGFCYICGKNEKVTWNTTKFRFKFYMTDKIGFASNLEKKGFVKNYTLCKDCYADIIIAEPFIRNNLRSYLAGYNVYLIPEFHLGETLPVAKLEKWAEYFKNKFNAVSSLEGWHSFQEKLEEYKEYERIQDTFMLNFIFAEKIQAAFKIYALVQDIPPSRLDTLKQCASETQSLAENILGGSENDWDLSLQAMYKLFPFEKTQNKRSKFILQFYQSLFSELQIYYFVLINKFLQRIWEMRFGQFNEYNFCITTLRQNLLLCFLKKLNLLKGGCDMRANNETIQMNDNIKKLFDELKYSEPMMALFLLGQLIGEIGKEQYNKRDKRKSILNKINFQGMQLNKIERLYNEIFEKMRQYKVISSETEKIYGLSKMLFEQNKNSWDLTPQENVFYILSGYSYTTYKAITSGKQKEENIEEKEGKNEKQ